MDTDVTEPCSITVRALPLDCRRTGVFDHLIHQAANQLGWPGFEMRANAFGAIRGASRVSLSADGITPAEAKWVLPRGGSVTNNGKVLVHPGLAPGLEARAWESGQFEAGLTEFMETAE